MIVLLTDRRRLVLRPATLLRPFRIIKSNPTYQVISWLDLPRVLPTRSSGIEGESHAERPIIFD